MNFGVKELIGLILLIVGIIFIIRMGFGILWIILAILGAFIIPNRKERLKEERKREKEIWEGYKPISKGRR